jgi:photosystem II stability/assembly factor-like uncharacterized protein
MRRNILIPSIAVAFSLIASLHAQWQILTSNTTADLRGIHNVGNGVAWASGTNGTVLRTEDSGYVWQTCAIPPGAEKLDFRGIQAFDANTAIVMSSGKGDLSRVYKTTDGCHTWKLMFTNPDKDGFWDAFWLDGNEGMLVGDPVENRFVVNRSKDGGTTWTKDRSKALSVHKLSVGAFAASNGSLARATRSSSDTRGFGEDFFPGFVTGGKDGAFLVERWLGPHHPKTRLGQGLPGSPPPDWNWRSMPLAKGADATGAFAIALRYTGSPCSDCGFGTYWHLVSVGGNYQKPDDTSGTAAFSDADGGWTWTSSATPPHGYRSSVAYDEKLKTWITVGPNGTDISTDDGKNWRAIHPDAALHEAPDADRNWNAISLPYVVGPKGRIGKLDEGALK